MNKPLTREEDADTLQILHLVLRKAVAKHQACRLELFFRLQFSDLDSTIENEEQLLQCMDVLSSIEKVLTIAVSNHPLLGDVRARQRELLSQIHSALSAAAEGKLDCSLFRSLLNAMQRFDSAINRFDMGITSSLTDVDELTGLLNRTGMVRDLKRELAQTKRSGKPLSLAMMDADHFKTVNDNHGHSFGDIVLAELADRFEASLRPRDRIYRYGGEEFLIALPDTGLHQAEKVMDRLRIRISEQPIREDKISVTQTVSIGLTEVNSDEDIETAIERADEALYQAKQSGRDRVITAATD
ncbi:GGDEF domain-containing protein [Methylotuvimicrobium sp. KM1]|uniref:GGDEF domain-containing protein n=1 Tax=Methylotuvimicrobium sp. KM1 TaxID=3377707 RepID=UPI00384E3356